MNFLLLICMTFLTFSACKKDREATPENKFGETITLKIGQSAEIDDNNLSISFQDLVDDSRCATGATCVWEGQVVVNLDINQTSPANLILRAGHEDLAKDTLDNIVYTLLTVSPISRN